MGLEKFCSDLDQQIRKLRVERETLTHQYKGACTRKLKKLEKVMDRATRKGIKEIS